MKLRTLRALIWVMLSSLIFSLAEHPAKASDKGTWWKVKTENLVVVGNTSQRSLKRMASELNRFHETLTSLSPSLKLSFPSQIVVIVFKNSKTYRLFSPSYQGKGRMDIRWYWHADHGNYIALPRMRYRSSIRWLFHRYARFILRRWVPNLPLWAEEGLADFYSTLSINSQGRIVTLGKPHLFPSTGFAYSLAPSRKIKSLFSVDRNSPTYLKNTLHREFHNQVRELVRYLMLGENGRRRPQLSRFLELVGCGKRPSEAFQEAFGADAEQIRKEVNQSIYKPQKLPPL